MFLLSCNVVCLLHISPHSCMPRSSLMHFMHKMKFRARLMSADKLVSFQLLLNICNSRRKSVTTSFQALSLLLSTIDTKLFPACSCIASSFAKVSSMETKNLPDYLKIPARTIPSFHSRIGQTPSFNASEPATTYGYPTPGTQTPSATSVMAQDYFVRYVNHLNCTLLLWPIIDPT